MDPEKGHNREHQNVMGGLFFFFFFLVSLFSSKVDPSHDPISPGMSQQK